MSRFLRLALVALALGSPVMVSAPAGATSPTTPFEEVAAARDTTQARSPTRQRRHSAQRTQRRSRDTAHRSSTRRPRSAQG